MIITNTFIKENHTWPLSTLRQGFLKNLVSATFYEIL